MAFPSVSFSFTNGTAADATQVNQNFSDLIAGLSDGTKNLSISAITAAGTATLNGNVLLGDASGDDIQFNGSMATNLVPKTQRTYAIGSADIGLSGLYLGMNSTHTILMQGPSSGASADYTLTWPATVGTAGQVMVNGGSGVLAWTGLSTPSSFTPMYTGMPAGTVNTHQYVIRVNMIIVWRTVTLTSLNANTVLISVPSGFTLKTSVYATGRTPVGQAIFSTSAGGDVYYISANASVSDSLGIRRANLATDAVYNNLPAATTTMGIRYEIIVSEL